MSWDEPHTPATGETIDVRVSPPCPRCSTPMRIDDPEELDRRLWDCPHCGRWRLDS